MEGSPWERGRGFLHHGAEARAGQASDVPLHRKHPEFSRNPITLALPSAPVPSGWRGASTPPTVRRPPEKDKRVHEVNERHEKRTGDVLGLLSCISWFPSSLLLLRGRLQV